MRLIGVAVLAGALALGAQAWARPDPDLARQRATAARVTITRDDWGIAHVHGPSDADAVFGMVYAQAEDDFPRIERNYLTALGMLAEAEGEGAVMQDLRTRLFVDPADLRARYRASPPWLKALMTGWADGLNYYLATHPGEHPKVLTRFEPWMALSFTEGSIGGDIESISLSGLADFYSQPKQAFLDQERLAQNGEPTGSNGIAIAPKNSASGHALLLINPHTSFYFRSELQVTSDAGLNAYGAATWGQPFLYQGFNAHAGWMHTSSHSDAIDDYAETIERTPRTAPKGWPPEQARAFLRLGGAWTYRARCGDRLEPVTVRPITLQSRGPDGRVTLHSFITYRTRHGPVVRQEGGRWIAVSMMYRPVEALEQSFLRTKATDYASYLKVAGLRANTSNNTLFADAAGDIAYLHPQFIPRRDDRFDFTRPVDGADPATDWHGLHALADAPHVLNPPVGWIFNTNDGPYTIAGPDSPRAAGFPRYMDTYGENVRGLHATEVLTGKSGFTLQTLIDAAYDPHMPGFALAIPALTAAWDAAPAGDPLKARTADHVALLRAWDGRWGVNSVETSLAVYWGETLWKGQGMGTRNSLADYDAVLSRSTPAQKLQALADASDRLTADFGGWRIPWGQINRFQRLTADIAQHYDDAQPSLPVMFASAQWGSLASFRGAAGTGGPANGGGAEVKRLYGDSGNSFVAVVEFGPRVKARAVSAGGESGHPGSPHFSDQAQRYATGNLRDVYFYPDDLAGHVERRYHPGQ